MRILGIDPAIGKTGWAVIESFKGELKFIAAGTIKTAAKENNCQRLAVLSESLNKIIADHDPDVAAIEETFVNNNARSSLILGQARGAILLTLTQNKLDVAEYAANLVKKSVTGNGHAEKTQVQTMVKMLIPKAVFDGADSADAIAVAICHSSHSR